MTRWLDIQLLGNLRIASGSTLIHLDSPRLQSLFAYLLLHPDIPQPRQHVAFLLWPDSDEEQARTNLRNLLHKLRQRLPEPERFLRLEGQALLWRADAPARCDVHTLTALLAQPEAPDRLERILELYREDLLPACYDAWLVPLRERLRQDVIAFLDHAATDLEAQQDYAAALRCVERMASLDPLREETYRRQMSLLSALGERAQALKVYATCVTVMHRELGAPPGPATQALFQRLSRPLPPTSPSPASGPQPPLVGRVAEWRQLRDAFAAAMNGQSLATVLEGEAGIGKTRLAEALLEWARSQGYPTALARCYQTEGDLPFATVIDLVRDCLPPDLPPVWRQALAPLLPELAPSGPLEADAPGQRHRLFEALKQVMLRQSPVLLLVDDVQWCDRDSLDWFSFLMRPQPGQGLLLLLTHRAETPDASRLTPLFTLLRRQDRLRELTLEPLDASATSALARRLSSQPLAPDMLQRLHQETEGNPLFVVELVRAGTLLQPTDRALPLPRTVQAVMADRLAALPESERALLNLASVFGRAFPTAVLEAASGLEAEAFALAMEHLTRRGILREQGAGMCDFSHGKLAEFVYAELSQVRRQRLHLRLAETLEALPVSLSQEAAHAQAAFHFEQAGALARAIPLYIRAADRRREACAYAESETLYSQALKLLTPQGDLELRWAALRGRATVYDRMARREAQAEDLASLRRLVNAPQRLAEVCNLQSELAYNLGDGAAALTEAQAAQQAAALAQHPALEALAWRNAGLARILGSGDDPAARDDLLQAARLARTSGQRRLECGVLGTLARIHLELGETALARQATEAALVLARDLHDPHEESFTLGRAARVFIKLRDYPRAASMAEAALAIARDTQDRSQQSRHLGLLGLISCDTRRFERSLAQLKQALELSRTTGERYLESLWLDFMGLASHGMGKTDQAMTLLEQALAIAREIGHRFVEAFHVGRLARVAAESGRVDQAQAWVHEGRQLLLSMPNPVLEANLAYAEGMALLARAAGEAHPEAIRIQAAASLEQACRLYASGQDEVGGMEAAIGLAEARLGLGESAAARQTLVPVLEALTPCPDGLLFPQRAWEVYARVLLAEGRPDEAAQASQEAARRMEIRPSSSPASSRLPGPLPR